MIVAFIGLGNMGTPMAIRLRDAGFQIVGFDAASSARKGAQDAAIRIAASVAEAVAEADIVVTMLPDAAAVEKVWLGEEGVLQRAPPGALLMDCSTIDAGAAQRLHEKAKGRAVLDAPVSGGVAGARAGSLAFMVGGEADAVSRAQPLFEAMGRVWFHVGAAGCGQAAKICNNMVLGAAMIVTGEAFLLGEALGVDRQKLFDVMAASSGQSWSLTSYCPVPGPVPSSPANRDYVPGFAVPMMLKDLRLAKQAVEDNGLAAPVGGLAERIYAEFNDENGADKDFSAVIKFLRERGRPD